MFFWTLDGNAGKQKINRTSWMINEQKGFKASALSMADYQPNKHLGVSSWKGILATGNLSDSRGLREVWIFENRQDGNLRNCLVVSHTSLLKLWISNHLRQSSGIQILDSPRPKKRKEEKQREEIRSRQIRAYLTAGYLASFHSLILQRLFHDETHCHLNRVWQLFLHLMIHPLN